MPSVPVVPGIANTRCASFFSLSGVHLKPMEGLGHDGFHALALNPYNRAQPAVRPFSDTQLFLVQVLR